MRAARCASLNFLQTERAGRSRLFFFLFLLSNLIAKILRLVHRLYKQEYDEGNNKKVYAHADKCAEVDFGARYNQTRNGIRAATCNNRDEWVNDVCGERRDDRRECPADDNSNSKIHNVAAVDELFEFAQELHHGGCLSSGAIKPAQPKLPSICQADIGRAHA